VNETPDINVTYHGLTTRRLSSEHLHTDYEETAPGAFTHRLEALSAARLTPNPFAPSTRPLDPAHLWGRLEDTPEPPPGNRTPTRCATDGQPAPYDEPGTYAPWKAARDRYWTQRPFAALLDNARPGARTHTIRPHIQTFYDFP